MAEQQATRGGIRHKAVRYGVPVAVAGLAAVTVGLAPALASSGSPDLPKVTAEELISKIAASETDQLSGTVKASTDLGLPALPGLGGSDRGDQGGPFGAERHDEGESDESEAPSADPQQKLMELASGTHLLRVAVDGPDKQRVSVLEDAAEYSLIRNGGEWWAYDSASNQVHHGTLPKDAEEAKGSEDGAAHAVPDALANLTPQEAAKKALESVGKSTDVRVDGTVKVAGQDAYQLVIEPKGGHSTVDSVRIAVDAKHGVPLKFSLHPTGGGKAAVDIGFTKVSFDQPAADTFAFTPPKGAEVTEQDELAVKPDHAAPHQGEELDLTKLPGLEILGSDWDSVAQLKLPGGGLPIGGSERPEGREGGGGAGLEKLLDAFTDKVDGDFGTGRVFSTHLVNALITEDGTVYVGAVTKEGLVKAAEGATK